MRNVTIGVNIANVVLLRLSVNVATANSETANLCYLLAYWQQEGLGLRLGSP